MIVLLTLSPVCLAQSLRVSPADARQGDSVSLEITLRAPKGAAPQVLQWETTIPTASLTFVDDRLQAGPAAQSADKSVTCAVKSGHPESRTLVCILAGGLKTIPDGVVARLRVGILPGAPAGKARIHTAAGLAVLPGLKAVHLQPADSFVSVRSALRGHNQAE